MRVQGYKTFAVTGDEVQSYTGMAYTGICHACIVYTVYSACGHVKVEVAMITGKGNTRMWSNCMYI